MGALLRTQWDRAAAWLAAGAGGLLLLIGYVQVSGTAYPAEQVPYLVSAGLGALFLLGIAGSLWISADLRDEYAKLDQIARSLADGDSDRQAPVNVPHQVTGASVAPIPAPSRVRRARATSRSVGTARTASGA